MIDWEYIRREVLEALRLVGFLVWTLFAFIGVYHTLSILGI